MQRMPAIVVQRADPTSADARLLIEQLDQYQTSLYPADSNHLLPVESLQQSNVTFITASVNGQVAGCGAFVNHGGEYAEIKRMFVLPTFRGLKLGRHILEELEALIRAAGLSLARLETGVRQPEALGLYEKSGYQRRGPFGAYAEDPLSVFMEKKLALSSAGAVAITAKPSLWQRLIVLLKSSAVGLAATACDLLTTTLLVRLVGWSKQMANIPGLVPGAVVMFVGNKYFAFEDKSKKVLRQGLLFFVIEAIALGLNALFFHLLVTWFDWHELIARLVGTNVTYLGFSFPTWSWLVFKLPGQVNRHQPAT